MIRVGRDFNEDRRFTNYVPIAIGIRITIYRLQFTIHYYYCLQIANTLQTVNR